MLLTDGNPNDTMALTVYETAILNVAATEGINLDQKLRLATEEISEVVLDFLLDHTRMVDPLSNLRRTIGVSDVVVSAQMKRWHALHTLAIVYRDAFNNQLNDRYLAKWHEYQQLWRKTGRAGRSATGSGWCRLRFRRRRRRRSGYGRLGHGGDVYYVQVTWVSATGQEGAPSRGDGFETCRR